MNAATARKLSPAMMKALASGLYLNPVTGKVTCQVSKKNTREALLRRGAKKVKGALIDLYIELDLTLTVAAMETHTAEFEGNSELAAWADTYINEQIDGYGYVGSGYCNAITMECWHRVQQGQLKVEVGEVGGWGCMFTGWRFSPVDVESAEKAA